MTQPPLRKDDHVTVIGWDEGVGIVRKVGTDNRVWVETECNMWRGADPSMFERTNEPLSEQVEAEPLQ
jgi:hypothetical protein